ncbi:branched-chain amino acid ABC transporter substrate-binding protein [Desulfovibrio legallii]|uniref:Amino acid/amide ABC transporter substrate-binding protein, HAAT family n=1 Tax=Desulfovibrio legallii TaxID=571438 RepID=A0A1G7J0C7_9BACT|nr:branched-chain amino acid ABC transporter substrate-binding protein [Desulfovibrio legallii]SDF18351.1 amino acid/amide ABC transporter substrate-binding protein, HAAT family [Desulfovibrio legallii]
MKGCGRWFGALALTLLLPAVALAADVKIGLMCPLTGKWASEGQDMKNIVSLLADEVNAKGGVKGRKIDLVVEDDAGDPRTAALAAQKLASSGVTAVIGTYGSAVTEASQSILDEAGLVQIGTGSTSVRLTEKGLPLFFRTCPRDDAQGRSAAAAIVKGGYKAVALLHDNSSYAKGLAEETKAQLAKLGVKVVFYDALTPGERDYTAILTKLKAAKPDLIFFTGYYPETGMLLRQKREMGWNAPMMGGDAANHQDLVKIAGVEAAEGYFFVSPPLPQDMDTPEAKAFLQAFQARYHAVPVSVWAVLAGDAFKAIVGALEAGQDKPEAMAAWLKQLKGMPALSGTLGFDAKGDRVGEFYRVYKVDNKGRFVLQPK